ncbi:PTB-containing, cubilin and LRP1-interacting protein [Labeo rohita]|uniref:PTB-containing, cubilin and LRP1-interacting protein n=1 Tax=Labeo rohita TaxID=84645 RepID=A0ABQ8L157_LABRO|nr:PTB-containing, cubilin and LRP1-interacting protein [Labeo rohita]
MAFPLKYFQRLLGHMAVAAAITPLGLLHVRPLQCWLHDRIPRRAWHCDTFRVGVTPECCLLFRPWSDPAFLWAGVPLGQISSDIVVNTDASMMECCLQRASSLELLDRTSTADHSVHKPPGGSTLLSHVATPPPSPPLESNRCALFTFQESSIVQPMRSHDSSPILENGDSTPRQSSTTWSLGS